MVVNVEYSLSQLHHTVKVMNKATRSEVPSTSVEWSAAYFFNTAALICHASFLLRSKPLQLNHTASSQVAPIHIS